MDTLFVLYQPNSRYKERLEFMLNWILIVVILLAVIVAARRYNRKLDRIDDQDKELAADEDETEYNIDFFVNETANAFNRTLRQNIGDMNLSRNQLKKKQEQIGQLREALTNAAFGDPQAKAVCRNRIKTILGFKEYGIDDDSIDSIIRFDRPKRMSSQEKFETILYLYQKKYDKKALTQIFNDYDLFKPKTTPEHTTSEETVVTEDDMDYIYNDVFSHVPEKSSLGRVTLEFNDKLNIISQRIFEKYDGLGAVDMLIDTDIDEVDAGVSGIPSGGFAITKRTKEKIQYSYNAIWIVLHGVNVHMQCMGFETQNELIRVCENIYQYESSGVMSRSQPYIVSTMKDGSRIVVTRPPMAESYSFFMRRFDSAGAMDLSKLIVAKNKVIRMCLLFWIIRGQRNMGITGSQGTGKTTFLKALIGYIPQEFNLRIQELSFELNLRFAYPKRNIETFQETDTVDAQEGLNLQKKTNGTVNIIGEVANAVQASHIIQTAKVASLFAMFTHHAKTSKDFVDAISNNLLEMKLYADKKDATAETAKVLNVDCHLTNIKGYRHIERITEIIPVTEAKYPSEDMPEDASLDDKFKTDAMTFFQRMTNPVAFETQDLVVWQEDENSSDPKERKNGIFKLVHRPSKEMFDDMCSKLNYQEEERFSHDLDMMERLSNGEDSEEIREWTKEVLSY